MTYRNVETGRVIHTPCVIRSPEWVEVKPKTPTQEPKRRGRKGT